MTSEEFLEAFRTQTPQAFAQTVAPLTEAQRKSLSKTAQQLLREAREQERQMRNPVALLSMGTNRIMAEFETRRLQMGRASLAVLAVCPKSAAAKPMSLSDDCSPAAVQIMLDRRPDWADDWLEAQFEVRWGLFRFEQALQLIRAGVCNRPSSAGYARLYASAAVTIDHEAQPDLFDDLWLLFQHDVGSWSFAPQPKEINQEQWKSNARPQRGESFQGSYFRLVYHLMHRGHLDRKRLFDEILAALWRDFSSSSRSGLIKLHDLMEPTQAERNERQHAYRELLRHSGSAVVGFGLQMLKTIQKDGLLDAQLFVEAVPSVMSQKTKTQPAAALSLLKTITRGQHDLIPSAAEVAALALAHESPDVQESALNLMETWSKQTESNWADVLTRHREFISPKLRGRLDAILLQSCPGTVAQPVVEPLATTIDQAAIRQRLAAIPSDLQVEFGLLESLQAVEQDRLPPRLDVDRLSNVLCDLQPVVPILDWEELIDKVSEVIETNGSPMEYERIMDAICRMRGEYPEDFEARTQALVKRIQDFQIGVPAFKLLLLDWLSKSHGNKVREGWSCKNYPDARSGLSHYAHLLSSRINVIRSRLKENDFGPLLSLPTHEHGWIDPRVFVDRIRQTLERGVRPNRNDLTFGLLRLAPDFRERAMRQAMSLPEPFGGLIIYALGGDVTISAEDQKWAGPFLSAGRTRSPHGRLSELAGFTFPAVTDGIEPAQYTFHPSVFEEMQGKSWYLHENPVVISVLPELPRNVVVDQFPTISLVQSIPQYQGSYFNDRIEEWMATLWPANTDSTIACGIKFLVQHLAENSSGWQLQSTLSPLLSPERSWSPVAVTAIWLGAISNNAAFSGIARDALAAGMQDGRAYPDSLIPALHSVTGGKWVKLNRLAESLRDVSRISRWAALVISRILDSLISTWSTAPHDSHLILEIQCGLLNELQMPLSAKATEVLSQWSGSGKSARLARELCQLKFESNSPGRQAALWEALDSRIARAERVVAYRTRQSCSESP